MTSGKGDRKRSPKKESKEKDKPQHYMLGLAEELVDDAVKLLVEYAAADEFDRNPREVMSELDHIEEMLDEASDIGWNGYWEAMEAISFLAKRLGIEWASPYAYCIAHDDGKIEPGLHLEVYGNDLDVIRKVAKFRSVSVPELVRQFAVSLRREYGEAIKDQNLVRGKVSRSQRRCVKR